MKHIIDDQVVLSRPPEGPLATQIAAFARDARECLYPYRGRHSFESLSDKFAWRLSAISFSPKRAAADTPYNYRVASQEVTPCRGRQGHQAPQRCRRAGGGVEFEACDTGV